MSQLVKDLHVSGLRYVGESASATPPSNVSKYKRYSIPYMPNRHCLGYIEGPAASLTEDTRNGRGYILKLWQNVEKSPDFLEGMKNATIVGELDHPEERIDYSLANGAVILTDWEIREDEGIVWARFAILDNQRGKDLLAYVKFGTVLGVSSRGLGDEIVENGRTLIDPDTYEFYCFDVVAFPAAECARQSFVSVNELTEAKSVMEAFSERVLTEASKCSNRAQLIELKNVVESTSASDKDLLVEAITDKISSLPESTGDERTVGDEDDADDGKHILHSNYVAEIEAKDIKINQLEAKLKRSRENAKFFRRMVQEQRKEIDDLEDAVNSGLESIDSVSADYEAIKASKESLEADYGTLEQESTAKVSQLESKIVTLTKRVRNNVLESRVNSESCARLAKQLREAVEARKAAESRAMKFENDLAVSEKANKTLREANNRLTRENDRSNREAHRAVTEAASEASKKDIKIKALQTELTAVTEAKQSSEKTVTKLQESVKISNERLLKMESYAKRMVIEYAKQACLVNGLKFEAVKAALPQNFAKNDVDKVVKTLSERQHKIDSLPITLSPISTRIVEHKSRANSGTDNSGFVTRALSNN